MVGKEDSNTELGFEADWSGDRTDLRMRLVAWLMHDVSAWHAVGPKDR